MDFRDLNKFTLLRKGVYFMAYIFIGVVVFAVSFSIIKAIKKRKLPSNNYTPFEDIEMGRSDRD
jgi:hypothetical protein